MALTPDEQELFDFAARAMPAWFRDEGRTFEDLGGAAKAIGMARLIVAYWFGQTIITGAEGATSSTPDWLNQHARDRGTSRQLGETDDELAERLRNFPDAVTRPALLGAAQTIIDNAGVVGDVTMIELRRERAFLIVNLAETGVGGTFTAGAPVMFLPDAPGFDTPPFRAVYPGDTQPTRIVISGAADAANDGAFLITGLDGNAAEYTNAIAVSGADPTVAWRINRYGPLVAELRTPVTPDRTDAYCDRGYRIGPDAPAIVVMLPFGTTEATRIQVAEMLRQKKAAGVLAIVERRANP